METSDLGRSSDFHTAIRLDQNKKAKTKQTSVTGVTLVKLPYAQESRQQDPVTLWSI